MANQQGDAVVVDALNKSWESLVGTRVNFSMVAASVSLCATDHYFTLDLTLADGARRKTLLQIPQRCLIELSSRMFGEPLGPADTAKCADAGGELCNILSACCIKLFPDPDHCETGLPQLLGAEAFRELAGDRRTQYRFVADHAGECLSLSILGDVM